MSWMDTRKRSGAATLAAATLALLLSGCDGDSSDGSTSDQKTDTPEATAAASARPPTCAQTKVLATGDIRGQATGATLWALPMPSLPFVAGRRAKIVWRMTGSGAPQISVTDPNGGEEPDALQWGPAEHSRSSWNRPGDEWGTGFRFADPGCWHITVRRDDGVGSIAVRVVDRA